MRTLLVFSGTEAIRLPELQGLLSVGGTSASGVKVPGLRHSDDYAVVGETNGKIFVHSLRGKKKGQFTLDPGHILAIEDLSLCLLEDISSELESEHKKQSGMQELLQRFADSTPLESSLDYFLKLMLEQAEMEKGILIARDSADSFQAFAKAGLKDGDPWLSEGVVREAIASGQALWLHNRIGSAFESNKSLIAAGFLSVFAIPLVARGEVLGTIVVGSNRPHGGLENERRVQLETLARIGALLFWFHRREEVTRKEIEKLSRAQAKRGDCPMLTSSPRLDQEIEIARRVATTRLSVLIQGETGVGKELMAQWIHQQSDRKQGPFVALNCGAIPAELLESILFGHKRGSFTGAVSDQMGKFQQANGGTLLLDEVGDLPERLQVKLLRVLQEGTIDPIGSTKPVKIDVRVIAATHRNLQELVQKGEFRQDLFFRIAETVVSIPPLRERPEDIALLATHFLRDIAPEKKLPATTLRWLGGLSWPGNVRELQSAIRRAAALGNGNEIAKEVFLLGLPASAVNQAENSTHWLGGRSLEEARVKFVQDKIRIALERSKGNRQQAADLLGVTARTLFRYLEEGRNSGQKFPDA